MIHFVDQQNTPDSPWKVGVSGTYMLTVVEAIPNGKSFLYHLNDVEGNRYAAVSKKSFKINQLVRCFVQFALINSGISVTQVSICKKQDIDNVPPSPKKKLSDEERSGSKSTNYQGFIPTQYPFMEGSPKELNKTGSYRFTVDLVLPCPGGTPCEFIYLMLDCSYHKYHAVSNVKYYKGDKMVCRVDVVLDGNNRLFFLSISDDESSQFACLVDHRVVLRNNYKPRFPKSTSSVTSKAESQEKKNIKPSIFTAEPVPVHNRKASQIFDSLRASGFHKCGKDFVCSCCGLSFQANQGIKSDTKDLYLCNSCRSNMRKRERKSRSVYAILTPMGNKR